MACGRAGGFPSRSRVWGRVYIGLACAVVIFTGSLSLREGEFPAENIFGFRGRDVRPTIAMHMLGQTT